MSTPTTTKVCSRCQEEKDCEAFPKRAAVKGGRSAWCKACYKEVNALRRADPVKEARRQEQTRNWYAQNPERVRELNQQWHQEHRDQAIARHHRYVAKKLEGGGDYTAEEWRTLCERYDNRCLRCGEQKPLTADHVMPVSKGGSSYISNIQPLCKGCNSAKKDRHIDYRPRWEAQYAEGWTRAEQGRRESLQGV